MATQLLTSYGSPTMLTGQEVLRHAYDELSRSIRVEGSNAAHDTFEVTYTVDTSIYASGDQIGTLTQVQAVFNATNENEDQGKIIGLTILDKSSQESDLELWFFDRQVTLASADNAAFDLTDINAGSFQGVIKVSSGDYVASASNSVAYLTTDIPIRPDLNDASPGVFFIVVSRGTPTYTGTTDLKFRFHVAY